VGHGQENKVFVKREREGRVKLDKLRADPSTLCNNKHRAHKCTGGGGTRLRRHRENAA
jgi:hypothetical protein